MRTRISATVVPEVRRAKSWITFKQISGILCHGFLMYVCLGMSGVFHSQVMAEVLNLGDEERVKAFYAYPNNCNNVCYIDQTLEETVEHYLEDSLRRDGFENFRLKIFRRHGRIFVDLEGGDFSRFVDRYERFLSLGDMAFAAARDFQKKGKWRYNWRFLMPLGLPMVNNKTLEVMNFPPVTLVLERQDYLNSNTTNRWEALLNRNGVPHEELDQYGAIADIVPVAAPAGDGRYLERSGIYKGQFNEYALGVISMWSEGVSHHSKPIIALGSGIRRWIGDNFGVSLGILDVGYIVLRDNRKVPIMAANHPSFFFYAAKSVTSGPDREERNFAKGLGVMKKDIVAACWQAEMGASPQSDPYLVKHQCVERWKNRDGELCILVEMQAYRRSKEESEKRCKERDIGMIHFVDDAEMESLERSAEIDSLDRS